MEYVIGIVLLVDSIMLIKFLGSYIRARYNHRSFVDESLYVKVGFLMVFHLVMAVVVIFLFYIELIVAATL